MYMYSKANLDSNPPLSPHTYTGKFSGRRLLSAYQLIMIGLIVAFVFLVLSVRALVGNFGYIQVL